MKTYELRYYQKDIVDLCLNQTGKDICVCAPTASGKSIIAYDLATKTQGRVAIITYANELIRQFHEDFPLPFLIGKAHYESKKDYENMLELVSKEKISLLNPITYLQYVQNPDLPQFDTVIWDEADACLGLLQLWDGNTYDFPFEHVNYESIKATMLNANNSVDFTQWMLNNLHRYWWEVKEVQRKGESLRKIHLHPLILSNQTRTLIKAPTNVLLSGTLLPTTCEEFLGHKDYIYREIPSIIPVENRKVVPYSEETFDNTPEGQARCLTSVLNKFNERPAIVHTTYSEAQRIKEIIKNDDVIAYTDPADKLLTLKNAEDSVSAVLAGGATTGLNLAYGQCRLNVILRGAFANLGNDFVRRRKSLEGGQEWYEQLVLRHFVQACGRSTRLPDDYSKIVVTDGRLVSLAHRNQHLLPEYFRESFFRSFEDVKR